MASRIELQAMLEDLIGSRSVYFQPTMAVKMFYPAIVYTLGNIENSFADDGVYTQINQYKVTLIVKDPDSELIHKIASLKACRFDRFYTKDDLNHYVYTLYF